MTTQAPDYPTLERAIGKRIARCFAMAWAIGVSVALTMQPERVEVAVMTGAIVTAAFIVVWRLD